MDKLVQATPATSPPQHFASLAVPGLLRARASRQGFDIQTAMDRFLGKTELFQRMAQSFSLTAQTLPQQLRAQLAAATLAEAQLLVHSFKGLAATLGADQLAALGEEAEAQLKSGAAPGPAWLARLEQEIARACPALLDLAQELVALQPALLTAGPQQLADMETLKAEWLRFLEQLRDADMAAVEAFAKLRPSCPGHVQADLDDIGQALATLSFEQAHLLGLICLDRLTA